MHDNDTPGYLAAGYLIAAEQQRQANNAAEEAQARSRDLARENSDIQDQLQRQAEQNKEIESDYYMLFNLLKQPMHVIAQRNSFFAPTYEAKQQELANVCLEARAFKELACQLGAKLGMSPAEVNRTGKKMRIDILRNSFADQHRTNADHTPILKSRGPKMLQEMEAERTTFADKYGHIVKGKIYSIVEGEIDDWEHFFEATRALAAAGKREAQFNLGYCFCYGIGIESDHAQAESWLLKARSAAEPASAMVLHYLYATIGGSKYDESKAEEYLLLAEREGHRVAATRRPAWEKQKLQDRWAREEQVLLEKLLIVRPGHRPPELQQIQGRGYVWEGLATLVHTCDYKVVKGETENLGSFFSPKKNTRCYLDVTNATEIALNMWAELDYDKRTQAHTPAEWSGSAAPIGPGRTTRLDLGKYHAGTQAATLTLRHSDKEAFAPLARLAHVYSGLKYGTLAFTLQLEQPIAV